MNSFAHNRIVCFIALVATIIFSLGTCSGYLFAADVTDMVEEEVVVEEAPVEVEAEETSTAEASRTGEPTGEGETPAGEEDGFWDGPWPWILGGAVVVGGGVGIAVAASGSGGGGGDDGYNVVGTWNITTSWRSGVGGTFSRTLNSGGSITGSGSSGSWTLDGASITIRFFSGSNTATYYGTVTSDTHMEGTMSNNRGDSGTWYANKTAGGMQQITSTGESPMLGSDITR